MGSAKHPVADKGFYYRMITSCENDEQCGIVAILDLTGMDVTSMCRLGPESLIRQDGKVYITWVSPDGKWRYNALVPRERVKSIEGFLAMRRKTRQHYYNQIKLVGQHAGYPDVSPKTFRLNRCLRALTKEDVSLDRIQGFMGCSLGVAVRIYAEAMKRGMVQQATAGHGWRESGSLLRRLLPR